MLENTEGAINNGQSRETGNIRYTRGRQTDKNTTQYMLDTTICKQTQVSKQDMSSTTKMNRTCYFGEKDKYYFVKILLSKLWNCHCQTAEPSDGTGIWYIRWPYLSTDIGIPMGNKLLLWSWDGYDHKEHLCMFLKVFIVNGGKWTGPQRTALGNTSMDNNCVI